MTSNKLGCNKSIQKQYALLMVREREKKVRSKVHYNLLPDLSPIRGGNRQHADLSLDIALMHFLIMCSITSCNVHKVLATQVFVYDNFLSFSVSIH